MGQNYISSDTVRQIIGGGVIAVCSALTKKYDNDQPITKEIQKCLEIILVFSDHLEEQIGNSDTRRDWLHLRGIARGNTSKFNVELALTEIDNFSNNLDVLISLKGGVDALESISERLGELMINPTEEAA